jgi:single-strand DNA-binding protein
MSVDLKMPDVNTILLAGNLTREPEVRFISNGSPVCKLGMAVNKKYKTKSGDSKEETLFISVTVWGKSAEWCGEHLKKGYPVLVSGRLTQNEWTDNEGQTKSTFEVNAERVQCLRWESNGEGGGDYKASPAPQRRVEEPTGSDDLPF